MINFVKAKIGEIHQRKKFLDLLGQALDKSEYSIYQDITVKDIQGQRLNIPDVTIFRKNLIRVVDDEIHLGKNAVVCVIETKKKEKRVLCFKKNHLSPKSISINKSGRISSILQTHSGNT